MSCGTKWQKAGFETEEDYLKFLENKEKHKKKMIEQGRKTWKAEQSRSKRLQDIIDSALRSQNYEDYEEAHRSKEWLIDRHGTLANDEQ